MNREQAKNLLPIIQAFAEGKPIEVFINNQWVDLPEGADLRPMITKCRIKQGSKYRPFKDTEECWQEMQKHQPFGWIKDINHQYLNIITLSGDAATTFQYDEVEYCEYQRLINEYTFADGSVFGVKE